MNHPYASRAYAEGLPHVGEPIDVPEWGTRLLARAAPGGGRRDATGPYPLTPIAADADLPAGLDRLKATGLVTAVFVADDRLRPDLPTLESAFERVRRFKSHFVYDRTLGPLEYAKHHRYEVRRAHGRVRAEEIGLGDHLAAWQALYDELAARHGLAGLHAFPRIHHETLARMPGVRTFGAFMEERLVAAHIFVVHQGYAVSHLAASSAEGYRNGAAYAVNDVAVTALTDCDVINFGGGAGLDDDPSAGLVRFKKGFSNRIAASYICGAILDPAAYAEMSAGHDESAFFPAYRGPARERSE
jgi:hypothetical protein